MTSGWRRLRILPIALVAAGGGISQGQYLTPNSFPLVPAVGHVRVETEYSSYAVDSFVDLSGNHQRFPGSLAFSLAVLRVSYSPARNVALGVEQPWRRSTFDEPGIEASFSSQGIPGVGFFLDWAPGGDRPHRWRSTLRFQYLRARDEGDRVLTISEGANRYLAALRLDSPAGVGENRWRGGGTFQLVYGPPLEAEQRFLEGRGQVELGHPIARIRGSELCAFGLFGYRIATTARQEGMFLHDRTSQGAFAGVRLDWALSAGRAGARTVRFSSVSDLRPRNAISGWRNTISFALTF